MPCLKRLRRLALATFGATALVVATIVGVLAHPQPPYAFHVENGRLQLYSGWPFSEERGRAIFAEVEQRLADAPAELADKTSTYRIFVTNDEWRKRLIFVWNYGAGGVNYYPIANNVLIRQSHVDADPVLRSDGEPVAPPRTLVCIWNRVTMVKDPDTRKRISRPNPESEWERIEVPELRIISDKLWMIAQTARRERVTPEVATARNAYS